MATTETESPPPASKTLADWSNRGHHKITCPTGFQPTIRFPDLAALVRNDALPEQLLNVALREIIGSNEDGKRLADQIRRGELKEATTFVHELIDLQRYLAVEAIVDPPVTMEDVEQGKVPPEDLEMIREIAMRERDTDARGRIIGVLPLDAFTTFRDAHRTGDEEGDPLAGHPAGLVESCPSCQSFVFELSTLGQVSV